MKGRKLDLSEKTAITHLIAQGKSAYSIGKTLDRSKNTIRTFANEPHTREAIELLRQNLADKYEDLADRLVSDITDEQIEKLNVYQRSIASGVAVDKANVIRGYDRNDKGQPTIMFNINIGGQRTQGEIEIKRSEIDE